MPENASPATDLDLISYLRAIPDARMRRGVRIPAWYLLLVAVLGILSGCQSLRDLERFVSRVKPLVRRFASINCYLFCLSPGNTGIRPSSDLASSLRSAPAEFARTTSHRVAQGYRTTTGIDPGPGGSPGPRGPWRVSRVKPLGRRLASIKLAGGEGN